MCRISAPGIKGKQNAEGKEKVPYLESEVKD